ncbi:hypothetical protein C8C85_0802 [Flavobacterium sp. 103]|uniref:hypothetical protein n=1 Tax=Flavobacterium sp. 103 TaxID=2135624 RepID=UPI000D5DC911|nr:hypothetical protein [Flavobacterium sp. 103]PVX45039.1 hypothetical protein C8C85_0802 [Flavobacterium sp. 103]
MKYQYRYLNATLIFCLIGFFIPGFTAILLLGIQMLLTEIGMECANSWKLIWTGTWIGMILLPILFFRYLNGKSTVPYQKIKTNLILFNLFEYIFIQASLASLFTNGNTLCYGSGGQNGIEFAFTALLALPILIIFSYFFEYHTETTIAE